MAKNKTPSKHSRAARRAASPAFSRPTDEHDIPIPSKKQRSASRPSVLAVHHSAGISKKSKPARKSRMSSKMRRRHEKGLEMAEAVTERTGKKIEKSITRAKAVQKRSRAWDEVNRDTDSAQQGRFGALVDEGAKGKEDKEEWETEGEDEEDEEDEDGFNPRNPGASRNKMKKAVEEEDDDD